MRILSIVFIVFWIVSCVPEKAFNIVLLPDTQNYSERYPEIYRSQTNWIAQNKDSIAFVLHQGDITNRNTSEQWENAVAAMSRLDGVIPYVMTIGNHDLGTTGSTDTRNSDLFNQYFPYSKHNQLSGFGGVFEPGKMENVWYTFYVGGLNWLVLSLEFGIRNKVLDWAKAIIEEHPKHKVIINTHAYMYSDDTRMGEGDKWLPQDYAIGKDSGEEAVNDGEQIWEKLVSRYPNILFVFSGHVLNDGVGTLVSVGNHGNKIYQMLANYQMIENGGNGFLRIVTVNPTKKTVSVKSYSPYINEYKTDIEHQFSFKEVDFRH